MTSNPDGCALLRAVFEEAGINVGIQTKLTGGKYPKCGEQFSACPECLKFLEFENHIDWCSYSNDD
jgi:hypothetical protein